MKNNILDLPNETLGLIFRELYTPYEKDVRTMFDNNKELSITPRQVVEVLHRHGLEEYASQIYIFFGGIYAGCAYNIGGVMQEIKGLVAAYKMADELGVDVSEMDPNKALEYYNKKNS